MRKNKFHRLIENDLTPDEKNNKEKTWQKILMETKYEPKNEKKSQLSYMKKWISTTAIIVLVSISIPIFIFFLGKDNLDNTQASLSNSKNNSTITSNGGVSNEIGNSKAEASINSQTNPSNETTKDSATELAVIVKDFAGTINIKNNIKYFVSDNGEYDKEIILNTLILDAETNVTLNADCLTQGKVVTATIVIEVKNPETSPFKVGEIIKLIVR